MSEETRAYKNTDRELWREREGDYYADSIHVTQDGNIGINQGGLVIVLPLKKWHLFARQALPLMDHPLPASLPMSLEAMPCRACNGAGWYVAPNFHTGDAEQRQCEACCGSGVDPERALTPLPASPVADLVGRLTKQATEMREFAKIENAASIAALESIGFSTPERERLSTNAKTLIATADLADESAAALTALQQERDKLKINLMLADLYTPEERVLWWAAGQDRYGGRTPEMLFADGKADVLVADLEALDAGAYL